MEAALEPLAVMERDTAEEVWEQALLALLDHLRDRAYRFVTPTPATHARRLANAAPGRANDLRDVFGWSMAFDRDVIDATLLRDLVAAGIVADTTDGFRSCVRVSSLGDDLLLHSAFPTDDHDAVFFGPDSYRFAMLIRRELARRPMAAGASLVDMGAGAGAGAIAASHLCKGARIAMTDVNPAALALARVNARAAGIVADFHCADDLSPVAGAPDLVLANPPYIIDGAGRAYRDGGGLHGAQVSLDMAEEAASRLAPGGRFLLYTGSAIVRGADALRDRLIDLAADGGLSLRYDEIDPDVFGEELETPAYRDVERIALVGAVIERPGRAA